MGSFGDIAKYVHDEEIHNLSSPKIIVPEIVKLLSPKSVLDIGCGTGTFLSVFQQLGILDFIGVDGEWLNKDKLLIGQEHYRSINLEDEFNLHRFFDVVLCLEVVEHLSESAAENIIKSVVNHGKIVVFSAAVRGQGGQNHINEQNVDYWQDKFHTHGYYFYDVFRSLFWQNANVQWWYKQNIFLIVHESVVLTPDLQKYKLNFIAPTFIHPELLNFYLNENLDLRSKNEKLETELRRLSSGNGSISFYTKNLVKRILNVFR